MELKSLIRGKLRALPPRRLTAGFDREAAVLMPVFESEGEPHFLLTRRTEEVSTHKGQVSFPGGMRHDGERMEQTALRETFEEVGIGSDKIEILGRYHDYLSVTSYRVVPFAGYVDTPFQIVPHVGEVAEVLRVPFRIFDDPNRLRIEQMYRSGRIMDVYYYWYESHEIWGLTARIIKDFLEELDFIS
jgi:8-oxo-dGTP pyrophosphatase MutT (NUDIX family)